MDLFETLDSLINKIKDEMLLNQNILKLVYYPAKAPLLEKDIDDVRSLVDNYIYFKPIAYDQVLQIEKTIMVMDFGISPTRGRDSYVDITFRIRTISHNNLTDIEINNIERNRCRTMCGEISKTFMNSVGKEWIGKCEFNDFSEFYVAQDYYGVGISFTVTNFKM